MNLARLTIGVAVLSVVVAMCGCSSWRNDEARVSSAAQVDPASSKPNMTPAEQEEAYWRAHGEGLRLVQEGQYGLAVGAFEKALELRPDSTEAMFNLGACHEAIGDPLRAINFYRQVLALTPNDPDCYRNLGTSFIKLYYREQTPAWRKMATDSWRRSLELRPEQPDVRAFLASAAKAD